MQNIAWLAAPYLSMLTLTRWRPLGRHLVGRCAITLPLGWVGVIVLLGALVRIWSVPVPVMAAAAAVSGLAMLVSSGGGDDDGPSEDDEDPPPVIDWDRFDDARRSWDRFRPTRPERDPAGPVRA